MITVCIPGKPVPFAKNYYTPLEQKSQMNAIGILAKSEMQRHKLTPYTGPVSLTVKFVIEPFKSWSRKKTTDALTGAIYPASKPDLSNYIKLLEDAINGIVYRDDAQIINITACKAYGPQALTIVTVKSLLDEVAEMVP